MMAVVALQVQASLSDEVAQLRARLKVRGQKQAGTKVELYDRLYGQVPKCSQAAKQKSW